jgi:hypothetical protein
VFAIHQLTTVDFSVIGGMKENVVVVVVVVAVVVHPFTPWRGKGPYERKCSNVKKK